MHEPPPIPPRIAAPPTAPGPLYRPADAPPDPALAWVLPLGRSPWAIAAGYLGLFSFIVLPGPLAVIVSLIAMLDLRRHPQRTGWGRAIFGLVVGLLASAILLFAWLS